MKNTEIMSAVLLKREDLLIFLIVILGFVLRITAVQFGLPHLYHADEPIVVNHALAYGSWDFNPHFFKIPPLISYLLFICYGIYFLVGRSFGIFKSVQDFESLFFTDPSSFYLIARSVFGVIIGTLTIYVLYRLILKYFDRSRALLSAFFLSVCFLHVRDSHYIYADIPLVFVLVSSFFTLLRILKGDTSIKAGIQAGAWIGLAAAIKYNGIALIIPYLTVCFLNRKAFKGFLFALLVAGSTFVVLNPYSILDHSFFMSEIIQQSKSNSGVPIFHHFTYSLNGALGSIILLLGCFSMIRLFFNWNAMKGIFALFCLGYYLILIRAGQPYDRYVLPILPFIIFLASDSILELHSFMKIHLSSIYGKGITVALIVIAIIVPFAKCLLWNKIMLEPDVRTVAKEWIENNIPSGSRIAVDNQFHSPRLQFIETQLNEKREKVTGYQRRRIEGLLKQAQSPAYYLGFLTENEQVPRFLFSEPAVLRDLTTLKERGFDYVVFPAAKISGNDLFRKELEENATLIGEITPYKNSSTGVLDNQPLTGGPFLWRDLVARVRNGYPILIFKIR